MNNPYKTPHAEIHDLSYQPLPTVLKTSVLADGLGFCVFFRFDEYWFFECPPCRFMDF